MLKEIDEGMAKRGLEAVLVVGDTTLGNPELTYVVGTQLPRGGVFFKKVGQEAKLIVSNIDVGSAKGGRAPVVETYTDYGLESLIQKYGRKEAYVRLLQEVLSRNGVKGALAIYGRMNISSAIMLADRLRAMGYRVIGEEAPTLLDVVRETKSDDEIDRIKRVGAKAIEIYRKTFDLLGKARPRGRRLYLKGKKLTVGDVKAYVGRLLVEAGLMAPEGTIFAVGPKSADPHYMGKASDPVATGQPIVFDMFPQEVGGGYWFDVTRTFSIGKPRKEVRAMFELVLEAQLEALDAIKEGASCNGLMELACDVFERKGYPTVRGLFKGDLRAMTRGFIHSLGHGVGLTIGERPFLGLYSEDALKPGHVFTVEPGLYDPKLGGVRIEDTVALQGGRLVNLTPMEKEPF